MPLDGVVNYRASPWGTRFHTSVDRHGRVIDEVLGAGASGPGKTVCLIHDPVLQMQREMARQKLPKDHPDYVPPGESKGRALLLRRSTVMLRDLVSRALPVFKKSNGGVSGWSETRKTFTWQCGYQLTLGHCYELYDIENYVGVSWTWIGFDELIQFEEQQYTTIKAWARSDDHILAEDIRIRSATNPVFIRTPKEDFSVKNPYWVREYFVDPHREGNKVIRVQRSYKDEVFERTRMYMPATIDDNPNPKYRQAQKRNLSHQPKHIQKALLYGDWYYQPGGYFEDAWDPGLHIVRPFPLPRGWKYWRSLDWGFKTFGVIHWWAMDEDEDLFIVKEYTFKNKKVDYVCEQVKRIESNFFSKGNGLWFRKRSLISGPADTQIWEARGDSGITKAKSFLRAGIGWKPATKDRQANAERVHARLKGHDHRTRAPGLRVFSTCTETIKHAFSLPVDPDEPNVPRKGGNDHWYDSVSYGVRFADRGSIGIRDHQSKKRALEKRRDVSHSAYGQDGYGG